MHPLPSKNQRIQKTSFPKKKLHKATSNKRFNMKKLIRKVVENMNSTCSQKYGYALDEMDEKTVKNLEIFMISIGS